VASDLYGLGATLFCALTGHAAFERRSGEKVVAQFLRITREPVPDLRRVGIPDPLAVAIERAMAGDPADRPATAAEFGEELRAVECELGVALDEMALPVEGDVSLASGTTPPTRGATRQSTPAWRSSGGSTTPRIPATKLRPPQSRTALVERRRLIDSLKSERDHQLTVIHAPAGYGKSTLAAQWRTELEKAAVPVAWLTVDDDDNSIVWFLAGVVEAIRRVRPELATGLGEALEERGADAQRYVLSSLINESTNTASR
jgi:serine/threonine-protein kinase PknK